MKNWMTAMLGMMIVLTGYSQQYDTIKVMVYNTLNYPDGGDPNREDHFRVVSSYTQPDVVLVNELTSEAGANTLLNDGLNVYGKTSYQRANFTDGPDTDNMLFYNSEKLTLYSQWYIPTGLRYINEYVLYYKTNNLPPGADTVFLYFYSAHLKAFPDDSLQRLSEVNAFKSRVNSLVNAENIIFGGDLNLYTSDEPAYQSLISDGVYPLDDPLPAGDWHTSYTYRHYHTQSTRTTDFGGGSTGGLDDRFDFILFSNDITTEINKVSYIPNSCIAFGNDGNHFNGALIDLPLNPDIPDSVTYALYYMSDHLPVIADFRIEVDNDTSKADIVITEIMYNPPEFGPDSLEFIELYNNGDTVIDLQDFYFESAFSFQFPAMDLEPGGFVVVGGNDAALQNTFGVSALQWISGGSLLNGGGSIVLRNPSGITIDSVTYDDALPWPEAADGDGYSLTLCDVNSDNSLASNWEISGEFVIQNQNGVDIFASPGYLECEIAPVANFSASAITIAVGESINFSDLSLNNPDSWSWTFEGGDPASSTLVNPVVDYLNPGIFDVSLSVSNAAGSSTKILENYIVVEDASPELIISEVMQNPGDVGDTEGEWFEVFNPTSYPIDIQNWVIADNDYDLHAIGSSVVVPASGFVVLGRNANSSLNGNYICDYQYSNFALGNGADEIVLFDPDNNEIDRIEYDGGPSWPDPNGSSMVFTGLSSDDNALASNWSVAALREPSFSGTSGDNGSPGTNGSQQNLVSPQVGLNLKVQLEGPFNGIDMNTELTGLNDFPFNQPFNYSPWNYYGTEQISGLPVSDIVDWILVDLRDAVSVNLASENTTVESFAGFVRSDGTIVYVSGEADLVFDLQIQYNLFVAIHHRNHLSVLSNNALTENGGIYTYDFGSGSTQAFNNGQKEVSTGVWAMVSGDSDASGAINQSDKFPGWDNEAGQRAYSNYDLNLDQEIDNKDKNEFWLPNLGTGNQLPD